MKALFYILAILAACAGTYFSYDLSKKFGAEQVKRLAAIKENQKFTANATSVEKNAKDEHTKLAAAQNEKTEGEQSVASLKSATVGLKRDLAAQDALLADLQTEFDGVTKAIEAAKQALTGISGDVTFENIAEKAQELANKKLELEKKSGELATVVDTATKKRDAQKEEISRLTDVKAKRDQRLRRNSMESVITAVNQEWGFVMVGAGSNTGFTPQTKLLVQRDGRVIGKVQPTSIEPNQTLANIDFDSLAPGVRLQPGDKVILAEPATN